MRLRSPWTWVLLAAAVLVVSAADGPKFVATMHDMTKALGLE